MSEHLRIPPAAIEAEQAVLGGLMLDPRALQKVSEMLTAESFYRHDHALIWRGIEALAERKRPFDAVTLGEWFESTGQAGEVAGGSYLIDLANSTFSAANIVAYAEIVADKALQRRLIEAGTAIVDGAFQPEGREVGELLADAQHRIIELQPKARGGLQAGADSLNEWFDDLQRRYESGSSLSGLPTPWHGLNTATHGLQSAELTLLAGRPSMGKSIGGMNLALFSALRGVRTAVFSLEMSRKQIHRRNIASLGQVPHKWLLAPTKEQDHWAAVVSAVKQIKRADLYIDDTPSLTINQVMARARNLHLREPIGLLVVDHIHDFKIKAAEARFEYGFIAQGLKTLAKEFNCPVVALAQLNRNVGSRADKRPNMTDLRESGELEQKADLILFLHREDYYDKATHLKGVVEMIVAKGRDIEAGQTIHLANDYAHMALRDWDGPLPRAPVQPTPQRRSSDRWAGVDA
jgi:replicative DNA helicase